MNRLMIFLALIAALVADAAYAIGTEQAQAPDGDSPLAVRIWYPDDEVGAVRGENLPLVVMSHGAGGGNDGHADTARALAHAGFVVAAVTHTGDNYRDQSAVQAGTQLLARPRHITRTIDYMLTAWRGRDRIDPQRIGMFGFSAGGFTALVIAGGKPDLSLVEHHCREHPDAWDCMYLARNGLTPRSLQSPPSWTGDARVKAAIVAAPAVAYSFEPQGLAQVRIPIQLWSAQRDEVIGDGADIVRKLLPVAPEYHRVDAAGHFAFLTPCNWPLRTIIAVMHLFGTEAICSDPDGFDRTQFHARFNADVVAFFQRNLPSAP